MTEKLPGMSASAKADETPQEEKESHNNDHDQEQVPEALARPSTEELEVAPGAGALDPRFWPDESWA